MGYFPTELAHFTGIKAYRNVKTGLYLHISSTIQVEDSIFADNGLGIDLERTLSPAIRLKNITIIGETQSYKNNVRLKGLGNVCHSQHNANKHNTGVEIRTWKSEVGTTGSIWDDVRFSGFDHGTCLYAQPISLDYTVSVVSYFVCYYTFVLGTSFRQRMSILTHGSSFQDS